MIDTSGFLTVAEAAKRLQLSEEQVRRKLREGKLGGQRIGQQWFINELSLRPKDKDSDDFVPLIPYEQQARIADLRRRIAERGPMPDPVETLREHRGE